jgi:hypothetical protein
MIKPIFGRSKWLASLIVLCISFLPIGSCTPANLLPVISSLTADYEGEINPADSCQIECVASDPDGDELTYTWTAYGGTILGGGSTVTWVAPDMFGICSIKVEVSDGRNGLAIELINIEVSAPNNPPVIESLTTNCPRVKPNSSGAIITCVASDPDNDELTYSWSADRGNISGEGSTVNWIAPGDYGTYFITVTVTDGRGGEASDEIKIIVCSCGSACP